MTDPQNELWYCLKAKTKREHIAAKILRAKENLTVFSPRISLIKQTVRGPKTFTEALFSESLSKGSIFSKYHRNR
jgi:hypothetical protein